MAEADINAYIIPAIVGLYFMVLLYGLRKFRLSPRTKNPKPKFTPHYSPLEKRHFLKGIPIGLALGILVFAPHFNAILGGDNSWFLPFLQIYPVIIYASFTVVFALFKFIAVFSNLNFFGNSHGILDGILASFVLVQIIIFIKYPLIFFPILE
ncbi:MAG: hypothetical protein HRU07_05180 [Nitrosopumilus sp.]|nr:hypothetical protein [Nitrosopumilus sp.]NRA05541.1 hypothetical protein [Nitrosopumilus sp.]